MYTPEQLALAKQWVEWHEMEEGELQKAHDTLDDSERMHWQVRAKFASDNLMRVQNEIEDKHGIKDLDLDDLLYTAIMKEVNA